MVSARADPHARTTELPAAGPPTADPPAAALAAVELEAVDADVRTGAGAGTCWKRRRATGLGAGCVLGGGGRGASRAPNARFLVDGGGWLAGGMRCADRGAQKLT